jgi:multidrug efflux pump subunit AcrA (membrane-fusion protein)
MAEFAAKEAELNFQVAQLELTHQEELLKQRTILSPINGVVMERALSAGEYTNETKHILTIAQIDPLTSKSLSQSLISVKSLSGIKRAALRPSASMSVEHLRRRNVDFIFRPIR